MANDMTHPPRWQFALLALCTAGLAACTGAALVGSAPDSAPPQLVKLGARDAQGRDYVVWDRPKAFGPVPAELQAAGDLRCMQGRLDMRAAGYHPAAKGMDGQPIAGGGYFCAEPLIKQAAPTPRVVQQGQSIGWDQPAGFGPVPPEQRERGLRECTSQNPESRPLGFHPRPLDINGQPIANGGFLCAQN